MRLAVLLAFCLPLATTSLSNNGEFSQVRDLSALKIRASDLDAILLKAHSFIDAANGSQDSEMVKVSMYSEDIEIPQLWLASSAGFPNEVFAFSYIYNRADKPISSVTIALGDSSRRVSVSGGSADQVEGLSKLLEKDLRRYSTAAGGIKFRRVAGVCLSMLFLSSLMISAAYCWNSRNYRALGMPICSAIGFLLVLLLPWNRFLPGFVLYQSYSPYVVIRHAPQILLLCVVAALFGIPLSYFLSRKER